MLKKRLISLGLEPWVLC